MHRSHTALFARPWRSVLTSILFRISPRSAHREAKDCALKHRVDSPISIVNLMLCVQRSLCAMCTCAPKAHCSMCTAMVKLMQSQLSTQTLNTLMHRVNAEQIIAHLRVLRECMATRRRLERELHERRLAVVRLRSEQLIAILQLLSSPAVASQPGVQPTRRLLATCEANLRLHCTASSLSDSLRVADNRAASCAELAKALLRKLRSAQPASKPFSLPHSFSGELCAVCRSDLLPGELVRWPPCNAHLFHSSCLTEWLSVGYSCPCCRTPARLPAS